MATRINRKTSGIRLLDYDDVYGKLSIPGSHELLGDRRLRRITRGRGRYIHRAHNGIRDPYTFFHVAETLLRLEPGERFTAGELTTWLNAEKPELMWDATTVGRVLNDMRESFDEANQNEQMQPLTVKREWSGVYYETTDFIRARVVLLNLVDDLLSVCEKTWEAESRQDPPRRENTPMLSCPSVRDPIGGAVENLQTA